MATTKVQSAEANGGKGGTLDVTLSAAPTSGNILVVACVGDLVSVNSVTNSVTSIAQVVGGTAIGEMFWKLCDGTESATTTFTLSSGGAAWAYAIEFNGPNAFQSHVTNSGSGTAFTAGTDGDGSTVLDVALAVIDSATAVPVLPTPSGYTIDDTGTGGPAYGILYDTDRLGSSNPGATLSASSSWAGIHATFETAAAGLKIPIARAHLRAMQQNQRGN